MFLVVVALLTPALGAVEKANTKKKIYTIEGNLMPPRFANVSIRGVDFKFSASVAVLWDGKFKFKKLAPGTYNIAAAIYRAGEWRQTYTVGPSTADEKGRVRITMTLNPARASRLYTPRDRFTISATRLFIPEKAVKEVLEAQKKAQKEEYDGAMEHLNKAIELAPQFAAAWTMMGMIDVRRQKLDLAEQHFREALKRDKDSFEPVIHLGALLIGLGRFEEAVKVNQDAVLRRPRDPQANAQLGWTYHALKKPDLAIKYLEETKRLDPGHFSNPQLYLYDIYLRKGLRKAAAAELEHFLRYHPDYPDAARLREHMKKLRGGGSIEEQSSSD